MKNRFFYYASIPQMFDNDPLEKRRRHVAIPDAFRIDDDYRAAGADTEARRLAALHAVRPEQQPLALEQRRQQLIELRSAPVRRTESSHADEHVMRVRFHACKLRVSPP